MISFQLQISREGMQEILELPSDATLGGISYDHDRERYTINCASPEEILSHKHSTAEYIDVVDVVACKCGEKDWIRDQSQTQLRPNQRVAQWITVTYGPWYCNACKKPYGQKVEQSVSE